MNLIHVPIELLEERYSQQWFHWFDAEFKRFKINALHVLPPSGLQAEIKTGEFLDVIGTLEFKSEQLRWICSLFRNGQINKETVFLIADAWFPGIELLAYLRDALKIPFKIVGIFHAGTWDEHDFLTQCGMEKWGNFLENSWFVIYDKIIVATEYHKQLLIKTRKVDENKIIVIRFPIYEYKELSIKKINQIVFPHRLAKEKGVEHLPLIKKTLELELLNTYNFCLTKTVCKNKKEYYEELARSKFAISIAKQETYGLAILESVLHGCYPVVPNTLSYKELYPNEFKFEVGINITDTINNMVNVIKKIIENDEHFRPVLNSLKSQVITWNNQAIPKIIKECIGI